MGETKTGYRALPPKIDNPSKAEIITESAFTNMKARKMQEASAVCPGHRGTTVWYAETNGYVIQIKLDAKKDIYARSICTFTPTMGMDKIDGAFAEDVEEYQLQKELGFKSSRLAIFEGKEAVAIEDYLRARGFIN